MSLSSSAPEWPIRSRDIITKGMDSTVWADVALRPDDIIISSYPKSGTTWMQKVVAQLLYQGQGVSDLWRLSPWMEVNRPNEEKLGWMEKQSCRRFLKSHMPIDALAYSPDAKYVYVARDGRDVAWSFYDQSSRSLEVRAKAGGFPPPPTNSDVVAFFSYWLTNNGAPLLPYFSHVRSWWEFRHLPNCLLVNYADLKSDLGAEMRRIAAFLDIPIEEEHWAHTTEQCSFAYMKTHAPEFLQVHESLFPGHATKFINKGERGRWREILPVEVSQAYESHAIEELGEECAAWLANGRDSQHA